jgi:glycosyltransferase involved in cell wall biosynthesis
MRVLMICGGFQTSHAITLIVEDLALQFIHAGHDVAILTDEVAGKRSAHSDARIEYMYVPRLPYPKPTSARHPERLLRSPHGTDELIRSLLQWRPNIVNHHVTSWENIPGVERACRSAAIPAVHTFHGFFGAPGASGQKPLRSLGRTSNVTTVSEFVKRYLGDFLPSAYQARVIVNGVDLEAARNAAPIRRERPYILCVARLNFAHKAVDVLIAAFARVAQRFADIDMLLAGDGRDRERVEALMDEHRLRHRVVLLGSIPHDQLWGYYKGATFFVMPSRGPEGLGLVFLEAMACGIAVIGTRTGGVPEIVAHGENGLLIERNDPDELAAAMCELLDRPQLRLQMGEYGLRIAAQHGWETVAKRYLEFFEECIVRYKTQKPSWFRRMAGEVRSINRR